MDMTHLTGVEKVSPGRGSMVERALSGVLDASDPAEGPLVLCRSWFGWSRAPRTKRDATPRSRDAHGGRYAPQLSGVRRAREVVHRVLGHPGTPHLAPARAEAPAGSAAGGALHPTEASRSTARASPEALFT
jgi:hypothetical protein